MNQATVEGQTVRVGDWVGFKCDIEQYGRIKKISRPPFGNGVQLTLENENGFDGEYIGGQTITTQAASDCWID